jgi:uncharacterized Zn-finger protein
LIYFSANTLILENKIHLKGTQRLKSNNNLLKFKSPDCDGSGLKDNDRHKNSKYMSYKYKCQKCGKRYESNRSLKYHMNEVHCDKSKMKTFSCHICGHVFTRKTYLSSHKLRMHSNGNGVEFKCDFPQCQYKTHLIQNLKTHKKSAHFRDKTLRFECETCDKICSSIGVLNRHKKVVHSSYILKCDFENCDFKTKHLKNLKDHKTRHTGKKNFQCEWSECGKCFYNKDELNRHMDRIHKKIRPFNCVWPQCEHKYKTKLELKRHMYSHTGDRPLKCDWIGCDATYTSSGDLSLHKKKHIGGIVCDWPQCGKKFAGI